MESAARNGIFRANRHDRPLSAAIRGIEQVDNEPSLPVLNGGPSGGIESAWAVNLGDLQSTLWRGWVIARQTLALSADFPLK